MRWIAIAVVLLTPLRGAAQEGEPSIDPEMVDELDLTELPDPELLSLRVRFEAEMEARHAELPPVEAGPWVLIPLGGLTAIGGIVSWVFAMEGPQELQTVGAALMVTGGLILVTGIVWAFERRNATRNHPSYLPFRRAGHAVSRLRGEERQRDRVHHRRTGRHPQRSPWY